MFVANPADETSLSLLRLGLLNRAQVDKAMESFERLIEINPVNSSLAVTELQHNPRVKCSLGCGEEIVGAYYLYRSD